MTTRMLINATVANELRIAIVEDGELIDLDIEATEQTTIRANIYKGVVHNVEGSLAACFVDFGAHKQGFLPFDEISPSHYSRPWTQSDAPKIVDVIKRGQEIVVQVSKDAIGEKGATLTTHLSLPGRFSVLMPGSDARGVSRKIDDDLARTKIRALAAKITRPEDCGFIVRTAGFGQSRLAIQKDLNKLVEVYEQIKKSAAIARAPSLLYAEPDLVARTLRDFFSDDIDEVWIDTREEYDAAVAYFNELMPKYAERLYWYQNPIPIFGYHHVEEQIEATFHRVVTLPSGGSIVIDQTEALVAIDVNSGKTSERDHEDTVYKTNLEAAQEVARQLRLRDLGGIIVIDFIDMELSKNERAVEKVLTEAAKEDKARYKISKINAKGLCVLTRQRIRQGIRRAFQRRCQTCSGTGWIRTPESHSLSLLRRIEARLAQGEVGEVRVSTHRETSEYLLNMKRSELISLERQYRCRIVISAKSEMDRDADGVVFLSLGEVLAEITNKLPPREERSKDRGLRRKKKKKRDLALEEDAEEPEVEAGDARDAGHAHDQDRARDDDRPARKKRLKRRAERVRDDRTGPRAPATPIPTQLPTHSEGAFEAARGSEDDHEDHREPGRFDGHGQATFTGRPPPEVLERIRRERAARRRPAQVLPRPSSASPVPAHVPATQPGVEPGHATPESLSPDGQVEAPRKLSLLERVLGARGQTPPRSAPEKDV